ncbi:MAG: tyrosine-protein phosphatase [bacterium]|nr:tyrosine-protein phosphatase [bacterium]
MIKKLLTLPFLLVATACTSLLPRSVPLPSNFDVVETARIYRGSQPNDAEIAGLKNVLGIKTILNLNGDPDNREAAICAKYGVKLKVFKLKASNVAEPASSATVRAAYLFMTDPANWPVYVHCEHGKDRTGFLIALHRIAHGWTLTQTEQELTRHGNILYPHIRRTLRNNISCIAAGQYGTSECPPQTEKTQ